MLSPETQATRHRYRLHERIGVGGMGTVYRAFDRLTRQYVALKRVTIQPDQLVFSTRSSLGSSDLRRALAEEFRILASLRHPYIISVLDYGFDAERLPYYTMELLGEAPNLLVYGQGRSLIEKVQLLLQLLQALMYLHRRGIIHRDLKPDNTLVVAGQIKVLDFGLAVARGYRSVEGDLSGTLLYIAPEVLQGGVVTESADLYAVGVLAYQLFAGTYPFDRGRSVGKLIADILNRPVDVSKLPVSAELTAVISTLLEKNPQHRYASTAECIEALCRACALPLPEETIAIRDSYVQAAAFVGRTGILQQLQDAFAAARTGKGSAWLIGGESGVGKSRLLDELRTHALINEALVVRGQAADGGGLPYQVWREPLRHLILGVDLSDLEISVLQAIVPDISVLLEREPPSPPELSASAGQQRLALTILDLLRRQPQPVVLLLEDLQWTAESLDLLKPLTEAAADLPLLIIGSYRNDETPRLPDQLPAMTALTLPRLTTAEVTELSAAMLGASGKTSVVVQFIEQQTEGNTFFMVEVVRALAEAAGRLDQIGQMPLPTSIRARGMQAVLQHRIDRVPGWGQALLQAAAVSGREVELPVLQAVLDANGQLLSGGNTLSTWLTTCATAAVLEVEAERWRFAHDKLREFVLGQITPEERPHLHRVIALALEAAYPQDAAQAARLAQHWQSAGDEQRAGQYAETAGAQALAIGAYAEAHTLFERALAALDETATDQRRAGLLVKLGHALRGIGEPEQSQQMLEQALALAQTIGDLPLQIEALQALGTGELWRDDLDQAQAHVLQGLQLAEQLGAVRSRVTLLIDLGNIYLRKDEVAAAEAVYHQSLDLGQTVADEYQMGRAISNLGIVHYFRGESDAALAAYERALPYFERVGHRESHANTLLLIGSVHFTAQALEQALHYYRAALASGRAAGIKPIIATALGSIAHALMQIEPVDLVEAEQHLLEALPILRKLDFKQSIITYLADLADVKGRQGDAAAQTAYLREALTLATETGVADSIVDTLDAIGFVLYSGARWVEAYEVWQYLVEYTDLLPHQADNLRAHLTEIAPHIDAATLTAISARNATRTLADMVDLGMQLTQL